MEEREKINSCKASTRVAHGDNCNWGDIGLCANGPTDIARDDDDGVEGEATLVVVEVVL